MAKILFVMTASDHWTLSDGTKHRTGFWAEEAIVPLDAFRAVGHEITVATPGGAVPPVDPRSLKGGIPEDVARPELQAPIELSDVRLDDYDAVYVPGGRGPMEDLAVDADAGRILADAVDNGLPVGVVCHGPAALLTAVGPDGSNAYAGYRITCFSNSEERRGGLADKAPWLLENRLTEAGLEVKVGKPFAPHVEVDRNVATGQNPASSAPLAAALLELL